MKNVHKINAFTLIEAMLGLIIGGIAIAIATSSYTIICKQLSDYKKNNKIFYKATLINTILKNDFLKAKEIRSSIDGIDLVMPLQYGKQYNEFAESDKIYYRLTDAYVLRTAGGNSDTLCAGVKTLKLGFKNQVQSETSGLVDELYFETFIGQSRQVYHYQKKYSAEMLMTVEDDSWK